MGIWVSLENFQDNYEKTLVWLLRYFEDSTLVANQPSVSDFIIDKIGNSEYLMEALDWDLEQLLCLNIEENEAGREGLYWNLNKGHLLKESAYCTEQNKKRFGGRDIIFEQNRNFGRCLWRLYSGEYEYFFGFDELYF